MYLSGIIRIRKRHSCNVFCFFHNNHFWGRQYSWYTLGNLNGFISNIKLVVTYRLIISEAAKSENNVLPWLQETINY